MDNRTETLLELYFANQITENEAVELRKILDDDPEAAAEWKWQHRIAQATRPLQLTQPTLIQQPAIRVRMWPALSRIAAALVVLLVATVVIERTIHYFGDSPSVSAAVTAHFKHHPNNLPFKSLDPTAAADVPADVIQAFQLYDDPQKYTAAAAALGAIAAKYPEHPEYSLYQGVALLGTKQYLPAIAPLQKAADSNSKYHTPALYYLGLAQSGAEQYAQARQSFEKYIQDEDGIPYADEAKEMLKILPEG